MVLVATFKTFDDQTNNVEQAPRKEQVGLLSRSPFFNGVPSNHSN